MKKFFKFLLIFCRTGNYRKARFFSSWKGASNPQLLGKFNLENDGICYRPANKKFTASIPLFGRSLSLAARCASHHDAEEKDGVLYLSTSCNGQTITAEMANHESLLCMEEIFDFHPYAFAGLNDCLVLDVGMNIGLSSLYFASQPHNHKVWAFELIGATAAVARRNISNNGFAVDKVIIHHAGVAAQSGTIRLKLTGAGDVGACMQLETTEGPADEVELLAAASLVEDAALQYPELSIVLKLECEGAEYEIMEALEQAGQLKKITALMIEWHLKGPEPIVGLLSRNGFVTFDTAITALQPTGFIYAINRGN